MFLEVFDFIYNWLFSGGLPTFLTVTVSEWIAFGLSCAIILLGLIIVFLPIIALFNWVCNRF